MNHRLSLILSLSLLLIAWSGCTSYDGVSPSFTGGSFQYVLSISDGDSSSTMSLHVGEAQAMDLTGSDLLKQRYVVRTLKIAPPDEFDGPGRRILNQYGHCHIDSTRLCASHLVLDPRDQWIERVSYAPPGTDYGEPHDLMFWSRFNPNGDNDHQYLTPLFSGGLIRGASMELNRPLLGPDTSLEIEGTAEEWTIEGESVETGFVDEDLVTIYRSKTTLSSSGGASGLPDWARLQMFQSIAGSAWEETYRIDYRLETHQAKSHPPDPEWMPGAKRPAGSCRGLFDPFPLVKGEIDYEEPLRRVYQEMRSDDRDPEEVLLLMINRQSDLEQEGLFDWRTDSTTTFQFTDGDETFLYTIRNSRQHNTLTGQSEQGPTTVSEESSRTTPWLNVLAQSSCTTRDWLRTSIDKLIEDSPYHTYRNLQIFIGADETSVRDVDGKKQIDPKGYTISIEPVLRNAAGETEGTGAAWHFSLITGELVSIGL